ncbi:S-adenosyl-L-methionine-dependent methyltransferase [Amylocarpus encephaloides]|uniref:S-adenosyl-L-methionine-dependent methyltransferase n=1 Tax=Amylocarpus encephaloides TaxID=45428 RepID=A0A9P7YNM6_9HELO|nr:S-adenosyl-L-methionine-dependent methyltransferase [Amylocarpus encephaloides]
MAQPSSIHNLSRLIASNIDIINLFYRGNNLPPPSLDVGAPAEPSILQPIEIQEATRVAIEAAEKLRSLLLGPTKLLQDDYSRNISLHAIIRLRIHKSFHPHHTASFESIATHIGMPTSQVRRILRHAMNHNLFKEPMPGIVIHSALTEHLYYDSFLECWVECLADVILPSIFTTASVLGLYPNPSEQNRRTMFQAMGANIVTRAAVSAGTHLLRRQRVAEFVYPLIGSKTFDDDILLVYYDWNCPTFRRIVEVGVSQGDVSIRLARRFPCLNFFVQTHPLTIETVIRKLPRDLSGRVNIMGHELFRAQPIIADIYYFRCIFHSWGDNRCIEILRNLIPSLHPGARLLIHEICVPKPDTPVNITEERRVRAMDMTMLMLFDGQERDEDGWEGLFEKADADFKFDGILTPPGSKLSLIMATWIGTRRMSNSSTPIDLIVDRFLPLEEQEVHASTSSDRSRSPESEEMGGAPT